MEKIAKKDIGMNEIPADLIEKVMMRRNFKRERPAAVDIPGPGQESVWEYPRPPRVEPVTQPVLVEFGGFVLAQHAGFSRFGDRRRAGLLPASGRRSDPVPGAERAYDPVRVERDQPLLVCPGWGAPCDQRCLELSGSLVRI